MDFSQDVTDEIFKIFQAESEEIISKLNNSLLELEKKPNNKDIILVLFRDAHTLKGASRMVGLTNIQNIAHKMEDVLGLAKENKIIINKEIINILYTSLDLLSELIAKAVEKKQDIYNDKVVGQIELLESIQESDENILELTKEEEANVNAKTLSQNISKINSLISECLYILMKIEVNNDAKLINNLLSATENLYKIFEKINIGDIKNNLEDVKAKLNFILKASNRLTNSEIEELQRTFDNIINKLIPVLELNNLEIIDYYSQAFNRISEHTRTEIAPQPIIETIETKFIQNEAAESNVKICNPQDLECIQETIMELSKNEDLLPDVKSFLTNFINNCSDDNVKNIFEKIIQILDFSINNSILLDEETTMVLRQSVEFCDNILKGKDEGLDSNLILQRLEIIRQVLELNQEKKDEGTFIIKGEAKPKKVPDFSEIFNTGEIKTLRIDSVKLDNLVNQVNELTITKIKTRKHLHELNLVNKQLEEWQKSSTKALNYLRYYDKKYFQAVSTETPVAFFMKQLLTLFTDNNKKIEDTLEDIESLYRIIQEDNTKISIIIDNLDNMVKNVRILPLATVFHLFGRMVRDIAQEKGKEIDLEILGSETGTDKKIIEEIKNPLIHIIRNAIDHGIETPEERMALGKNPRGKIILSARPAGNKIIIEIQDDGRGLNLAKIREKAIQKGFLTTEEINSMTDEQLTNIIFAPGFSTGDEITNISGRGIGLDVVQTKIAQLNGRVKMISEVNKGCCVQIELPTTMSTLKAFLVQSAGQIFAIPMETINTVLRKNANEITLNKGKKSILFNDKTILLYDLANILNIRKESLNNPKETILILENDNKMIALAVDKLLGDQDILQKKLCAPLYKLKNISGITTLASGEICLILNINDIFKVATQSKTLQIKTEQKRPNETYKILVVDDSITTRTLEKNILEKAGYTIETATNPLEAFEKMETVHFDLIVTDVEMPEMDGFNFLEKIKTDEKYSEIPVIMVSSIVTEENKTRAKDLGAAKYIVKHEFAQDEFLNSISKIINNI